MHIFRLAVIVSWSMDANLAEVLEALLFSSSEPLSVKAVQSVFSRAAELEASLEREQGVLGSVVEQVPSSLPAGRIREAMEALKTSLEERGSVYELVEVPEGWRLLLRAEFASWVRLLREEPSPKKLGASVVETLAVVAYRQPITRAEIEAIRGVACERALAKLLEMDLLRIAGRADLPGRPLQYATTTHFLEFCGLGSLEQLPASDVISPDLLNDWLKRDDAVS